MGTANVQKQVSSAWHAVDVLQAAAFGHSDNVIVIVVFYKCYNKFDIVYQDLKVCRVYL